MTTLAVHTEELVTLIQRATVSSLTRGVGDLDVKAWNAANPTHPKGADGKFVDVPDGGIADVIKDGIKQVGELVADARDEVAAMRADKLRLGKLAPDGFTVRSSKKLKTDNHDVGVAEVDGPDGPHFRVGVIGNESGKWDAGFTSEGRKAELRRQIAEKRAIFDSDDDAPDDIEDQIGELESALEDLDNERTAIVPLAAVADFRRQLGDAATVAKANKVKQDASVKALDALDEQRDRLIDEHSDADLERQISKVSGQLRSSREVIKRLETGPNPRISPERIPELLEMHRANAAQYEAGLAPLMARRAELMPPDARERLEDLDAQYRALTEDDIDDMLASADVPVPSGGSLRAEIWGSDDEDEGWTNTRLYVLSPGETTDDADQGEDYGYFRGLKGLNKLLAGLDASDGDGSSTRSAATLAVSIVDALVGHSYTRAQLRARERWLDDAWLRARVAKLSGEKLAEFNLKHPRGPGGKFGSAAGKLVDAVESAEGRAPKADSHADVAARLHSLPPTTEGVEQAYAMLSGMKVAELKGLAQKAGPTVNPKGNKKQLVDSLVEGTVGYRARAKAIGGWPDDALGDRGGRDVIPDAAPAVPKVTEKAPRRKPVPKPKPLTQEEYVANMAAISGGENPWADRHKALDEEAAAKTAPAAVPPAPRQVMGTRFSPNMQKALADVEDSGGLEKKRSDFQLEYDLTDDEMDRLETDGFIESDDRAGPGFIGVTPRGEKALAELAKPERVAVGPAPKPADSTGGSKVVAAIESELGKFKTRRDRLQSRIDRADSGLPYFTTQQARLGRELDVVERQMSELNRRLRELKEGGGVVPKGPAEATTSALGRDLLAAGDLDIAGLAEMVRVGNTTTGAGGYDDRGADAALSAIAQRQGFDRVPKVVSGSQLDKRIAAGEVELFRNVSPFGAMSAGEVAEQFRSGPAYYGSGEFGSGIYATTDRERAERYGPAEGRLRMVISAGARTATVEQLSRIRHERGVASGWPADETLIFQDLGRLGAALGFEAIVPEPGDARSPWVILDRGAITVEQAGDAGVGRSAERAMSWLLQRAFDEGVHPRRPDGRFVDKPGGGSGGGLMNKLGMEPAWLSTAGHLALDVAGWIPGWGEPADLANAAWYLAEKNYPSAALSAFSAIPVAGNVTGAAKAAKGFKSLAKALKVRRDLRLAKKLMTEARP